MVARLTFKWNIFLEPKTDFFGLFDYIEVGQHMPLFYLDWKSEFETQVQVN